MQMCMLRHYIAIPPRLLAYVGVVLSIFRGPWYIVQCGHVSWVSNDTQGPVSFPRICVRPGRGERYTALHQFDIELLARQSDSCQLQLSLLAHRRLAFISKLSRTRQGKLSKCRGHFEQLVVHLFRSRLSDSRVSRKGRGGLNNILGRNRFIR
ncbi:hypothetical protein B0H15DRAFT_835287 [Mycena belliarum]|uniref:Uncharacterized protein n=1 Tax=Mycena belliarum TaxID=1033014 RepID=A0AAD6U966_9AGAR|nr:hypothetical protein B0H15DRAFT_835287 [Mycena belliae]